MDTQARRGADRGQVLIELAVIISLVLAVFLMAVALNLSQAKQTRRWQYPTQGHQKINGGKNFEPELERKIKSLSQ